MTKYYYRTEDGKICRLHERRVSLLLNEIWTAILCNHVSLVRYPDGDDTRDFAYCAYVFGRDSQGYPLVRRYWVDGIDEFEAEKALPTFSTSKAIEVSYSAFMHDLLTYGDTLAIEDSKTGEILKTFSIQRGA